MHLLNHILGTNQYPEVKKTDRITKNLPLRMSSFVKLNVLQFVIIQQIQGKGPDQRCIRRRETDGIQYIIKHKLHYIMLCDPVNIGITMVKTGQYYNSPFI